MTTRESAGAASLTAEQVARFEERGHVRVEAAFPRELALKLQENMWAELRHELGIDRQDPGSWSQPRRSLRRAKWDPLQRGIGTPRLATAIDALLGPRPWRVPSNWGVVLVTFPTPARFLEYLPRTGWHYDFDLADNAIAVRGLLVLTLFSAVGPRGGGTLIVEGSHRLLRRFAAGLSADDRCGDHLRLRRRFLRCHPWLQALSGTAEEPADRRAHFMREADIDGIPVRVTELTGEPGDAVLCHPLLLHVAAPNHADTPRFMRSQRICADAALDG